MEQNQIELSFDEVVRIGDASKIMGCSIESLLSEAAKDDRLLYVALQPHSATLRAIRSHENPQNATYTTKGHKIVLLQQHYAESLAIAGSADVAQYQASFGGVLDWHYWMLDKPQRVGVDMVFVPRSQLPMGQSTAQDASVTPTASEQARQNRASIDITSQRGARRRILEEWESIEKEYGHQADGVQVLRVLKRDTAAVQPAKKTVQNHLCKLRNEKLIP